MKKGKILAVIALIALTGFLWIACDSGGGSGGGGSTYAPSDKTTSKDAGNPSVLVTPDVILIQGGSPFAIPYTQVNSAGDILDWRILNRNPVADFSVGGALSKDQETSVYRTTSPTKDGKVTLTASPTPTAPATGSSFIIQVYGYKDRVAAGTRSSTNVAISDAAVLVATVNVTVYPSTMTASITELYVNNLDVIKATTYYQTDTIDELLAGPWKNVTVTAKSVNFTGGSKVFSLSACTFTLSDLSTVAHIEDGTQNDIAFTLAGKSSTFPILVKLDTVTGLVVKNTTTPYKADYYQFIDDTAYGTGTLVGLVLTATWSRGTTEDLAYTAIPNTSRFDTAANKLGEAGTVSVLKDGTTTTTSLPTDLSDAGEYEITFAYGDITTILSTAIITININVVTEIDVGGGTASVAVSIAGNAPLPAVSAFTSFIALMGTLDEQGITVTATFTDDETYDIAEFVVQNDLTNDTGSWTAGTKTISIGSVGGLGGGGSGFINASTNLTFEIELEA